MIFKPGLVDKILTGRKTMTRRPVKPGELACALALDRTTTEFVPGCRYVPGRDYAIQPGRSKPAIARVMVTAVRIEELGEITPLDAQAEGFKRTDEFFDDWRKLYGFVDSSLLVWAIAFELVREAPLRLLAADSSHGYTTEPARALAGELEAVDEQTLERYTAEARQRFERGRMGEFERREDRSLLERLRQAQREARRRGLGDQEMRVIRAQIEQLERKLREIAA